MFSEIFLAMTAVEAKKALPDRVCFMSCRFSPYSAGLTNLPSELPPNSMLLLDDSMPPAGHDPKTVIEQLCGLVKQFSVCGVLLDFQREKTEVSNSMVHAILQALPCPVAVTEDYARDLGCLVFLSACPANVALEKYLQPWKQGVYLEIAPSRMQIAVTEDGASTVYLSAGETESLVFYDERLCCHYKTEVFENRAVFTFQRNREDLEKLIQKAQDLGVVATVGLYQELRDL